MSGRFSRLLRGLLPMEAVALAGLVVALALSVLGGVPFSYPSASAARFVAAHYLGGATLAALLVVMATTRRRGRPAARTVLRLTRALLALTVVLWLHFNLKLWSGLLNPQRHDAAFQQADQALAPLLEGMRFVAGLLSMPLGFFGNPYQQVFIAMFVGGFLIAAISGRRALELMMTAVAVVMVLGGMAYSFAPAMGPFIYEFASPLQFYMLDGYQLYLQANGDPVMGAAHFTAAVAAMPSLHAANAAVLTYYAHRLRPASLLLLLPLTIYICTEAVSNGFHYLVDIPAGLLVAAASIWITRELFRLCGDPGQELRATGPTLRREGD